MSNVSNVFTGFVKSNVAGSANTRTPSEYDGLWINVGVSMGDTEEDSTFVRLPRGIAVSDLKPRKVYDNMDPDFAAQVNLMNQLVMIIQKKCLELNEGEAVPIQLEAQLYRRKEEVAAQPTPKANDDLASALFG